METIAGFRINGMSFLLIVSELERAIAFYREKLGFEVDFRYEDFYAGISKDGFSMHLKCGLPSVEERENMKKNAHVDATFSVENIAAVYAHICAKSVEIVQPLREMPYGKEFYIADPDGYILAFVGQN